MLCNASDIECRHKRSVEQSLPASPWVSRRSCGNPSLAVDWLGSGKVGSEIIMLQTSGNAKRRRAYLRKITDAIQDSFKQRGKCHNRICSPPLLLFRDPSQIVAMRSGALQRWSYFTEWYYAGERIPGNAASFEQSWWWGSLGRWGRMERVSLYLAFGTSRPKIFF